MADRSCTDGSFPPAFKVSGALAVSFITPEAWTKLLPGTLVVYHSRLLVYLGSYAALGLFKLAACPIQGPNRFWFWSPEPVSDWNRSDWFEIDDVMHSHAVSLFSTALASIFVVECNPTVPAGLRQKQAWLKP